jgi:phage/plasmid-like protein (TIGR03299 family)
MRINLGKDVSKARTVQECMEIAELDYTLELQDIFLQGTHTIDDIPVIGNKVPDKYAVVRLDKNEPIGVVGNRYEIEQNSSCFGFFDGLIEQGYATFHRAYSTHNGAKVCIIADLGDIDIGGDAGRKRITLRTSHDGSCKIIGILEVYRLVCSNGLMAFSRESSFAIKHTKSCAEKLKHAKEIFGIANQYYEWFSQQADKLVNTPITTIRAKELIKQFIPVQDEDNISARAFNQRTSILNAFMNGIGNHGKTMWDLYNGVVEFVDHQRSRNREEEIAVESNTVGSGAKMKQNAFAILTQ